MLLQRSVRGASGFGPTAATVVRSRELGPVRLLYSRAHVAGDAPSAGYSDPGDALVWAFVAEGAIVSKRTSSDLESRPGVMTMSHMPRVSGFAMTPDLRAFSIRMDREAIGLSASDIDAVSRTVFPTTEGLPLMIGTLAAETLRMEAEPGPASTAALAHSILDLTVSFVDDVLGRRTAPETVRGALVAQARRLVELSCGSPSLTAASVAAELGVSSRTLQKAFEPEGATLARTITEARLARARSLMERDRTSTLTVSGIGARSGFSSAAAFSRAFHARYGLAPRDWRERYLRSIAD